MNIVVLASTNATDLDAIAKAIDDGTIDATIRLIANKECGAIERAKRLGIKARIVASKGKEREAYDKELAGAIEKTDLIVLIGWMRILSPWFVNNFKEKIINIHPSLLPAFAGGMDLNVHEEVLNYGCKITGCTLHFVTEEADEGPIILQKCVTLDEDETPDSLKAKVQAAEQHTLVKGITLFLEGKLTIEGRRVHIDA